MEIKNILLAGVGGQGLVLTTNLICKAALKAGYDVKSNDVVGLSQRGGKVWGNIRFGKQVYSPNIPKGEGDIILAMEPLEGLRWSHFLKEDGLVIVNIHQTAPLLVLMEKEEYPDDIFQRLEKYNIVKIDATAEGKKLGSTKIANTFLVGIMAKHLEIGKKIWLEAIKENVPDKYVNENLKAFEIGYTCEETKKGGD